MTAPYPFYPVGEENGSMIVDVEAPDHTHLRIIVSEAAFGTETMHAAMRAAVDNHMSTVDVLRNQPGETNRGGVS